MFIPPSDRDCALDLYIEAITREILQNMFDRSDYEP